MKKNHNNLKSAVLLCAAIIIAQPAISAQKTWTGGSGDDNWSTPGNWLLSGAPASGDDVVFTKTDALGITGGVNNIVDAAFSGTPNSLQYLNTNSLHRTSIPGSLTITGSDATPYPLFAGSGADDGATAKHYSTIQGDSLTVNNPNSSIIVRQGSATSGAHWSHMDLSGLNTLTANVQSLLIAYEDDSQNQNRRPSGRLILAKTNYITCTSPGIGYQIAEVKQQGGQACTNLLGQVNYFNVNSMRIGGAKFGSASVPTRFTFKPGLVSPSVTFRDATGSGRQTAWYIGDDFTTYNSSGSSFGMMDLSGGTVDALVDTIYVGRGQQYCVGYAANGNGTLTFNVGTIDVNTLEIGYQAAAGSSKGIGVVNVNGTALLSVNESLRLARDIGMGTSTLANNSSGILNVNGGTVRVFGDLVDGGGVTTINVTNNGTLDLQPSGDALAGDIAVDTLNLSSGTIANYATLSFANLNVLAPATDFTVLPGQGLSAAGKGTLGLSTVTGNLTLTNATLYYELADSLSTSDRIDVYGNLALTGTNIVDISAVGAFGAGTYTLMTYTTLAGDANNLKAGGVLGDSRYTPTFDTTTTPGVISLTVGGTPAALTWSGGNNANAWDLQNTLNWNSGTEKFYQLDSVTFDDTGSVSPAVNVVGSVIPGTVTFNGTQSYTLSGSGKITGGASVAYNSSGTLTVLTTNDNVGAIDINAGALQLGNGTSADGALGTGALNLNNGSLILNAAGAQNVANSLSGYGQITKRGPGVAVLSGANTPYQGSIVIEAGTLKAGSGTAMGGTSGGLTNTAGGTLDIGGQSLGTEPVTVSGAGIAGIGAIINTGASQPNALQDVVLTGNTTFGGNARWDLNMDLANSLGLRGNGFNLTKAGTNQVSLYNASVDTPWDLNLGQIEVQAGMLSLQGSLALGVSGGLVVRTNAMLDLCNLTTNAIAKALTLDDGAYVRSRGVNLNFTNLCIIDGPVSLSGTVIFDNLSGNTVIVNGAITGTGGLSKTISGVGSTGTGTLILNGNNAYAGNTLVNNGTLMVNGTLSQSPVTVASGATLAGSGTGGASLTVDAGGSVAPGTPAALGTLTVVNTATLQGDTKIRLNTAGTPKNDALSATAIGLGGTLTVANVGPMLKSGDSFKLFSGTLSGAITPALPPLWPGLSWNTASLNTLGSISVTGTEVPPQVTAAVSGGNFNMIGSGGMAGVTYYVLASTNVAEPFNNWIPVSTNVFDASGNFNLSIALDPAVNQNFYRMEVR